MKPRYADDDYIVVTPADFEEFIPKTRAFLDSIKNDPHPLKTQKTYRKILGDLSPRYDAMMKSWRARRDHDSFDNFRRFTGQMGIREPSIDLLLFLCDDPQTFIIGSDLGELLLDTDLKGGERQDLHLPFRTIYLQMPPNKFRLWSRPDKPPQMLEGVYVTSDNAEVLEPGDERASWMVFLLVGHPEDGYVAHDGLFSAPILVRDGDIESRLAEVVEKSRAKHPDLEHHLRNLDQIQEIIRWTMNCVLYINSEGAELSRGWFHEKTAQTMQQARGGRRRQILHTLEVTSAQVTWVGRSIRIDKLHHEGEPRGPLEDDRMSPRLHRVRGFWRHQVCGVGRSERKLIWVRPYLRGTGRDVVEKMYKVT